MTYSGKEFEDDFRESFDESNADCSLIRLYDTTNGFRGVANPCDFIMGTNYGTMLLECKTTQEASFSFDNLTSFQLEAMSYHTDTTTNTKGGVLIYFRKYPMVVYYPIELIRKLIYEGKKSINPTKLEPGRFGKEISITRKRIHIKVDIDSLLNAMKLIYVDEAI